MATDRHVDIRTLPGSSEANERAARLASALPDELVPLARIAFNYRWSWEPGGPELFRSLDPHAWELNGRNPVRQLEDLSPQAAAAALNPARSRRFDRLTRRIEADLARPETEIPATDGPVAFVCAEFGIHSSLPIYSGGLGALAGDILKQASDLALADGRRRACSTARGTSSSASTAPGYQHEYWTQTVPGAPADRPGARRRRRAAPR